MTSQSRAVRLILQSRCLLSRRCTTATLSPTVFHPSYQHRCASSQKPNKTSSSTTSSGEEDDAPIPYTTSKARDWSVYNSYGRHKKRPWYKVAPISIGLTIFMAWVFLRKETEIDRELEVQLHERLPNLFQAPDKDGISYPASDKSLHEDADDETPEKD